MHTSHVRIIAHTKNNFFAGDLLVALGHDACMAHVATIVGLDLSLTGAAMCALRQDWAGCWDTVRFGKAGYKLTAKRSQADRVARIVRVTSEVVRFCEGCARLGEVKVYAEGYAFSRQSSSVTQLAELGGAVRYALGTELGVVTQEMTASRARAYLLGKLPRKNQKALAQAAVRSFCPVALTGDEADAFVVANAALAEQGGVGVTLAEVAQPCAPTRPAPL